MTFEELVKKKADKKHLDMLQGCTDETTDIKVDSVDTYLGKQKKYIARLNKEAGDYNRAISKAKEEHERIEEEKLKTAELEKKRKEQRESNIACCGYLLVFIAIIVGVVFGIRSCYNNNNSWESGVKYERKDGEFVVTKVEDDIYGNVVILDNIDGTPVTRIEDNAFSGCKGITEITIPKSIKEIGKEAFSDCTRIKTIYYNATSVIDQEEYSNVFKNAGTNPNNTKLVIGATVEHIPNLLFANSGITDIVFEDNGACKTIGERAFSECSRIQTVSFGKNSKLTHIKYAAFSGCTSLESVLIPDSLIFIEDYAFWGGESLETVSFGKGLQSLGNFAFQNCVKIESISLPSGVKSIGHSAFLGCNSIKAISIPFVGEKKEKAENPYLRYIFMHPSYPDQNEYIPETLKTVEITAATSIPASAFSGCTNISVISLPQSVKTIEPGAFKGCASLTSINIPASVTAIGTDAFRDCAKLTEVTFGEGGKITSIGAQAFYNCKCLSKINLPSDLTSIGEHSFGNCVALTDFIVPRKVTSIGASAFSGCSSLKSITLPFIGATADGKADSRLVYIFSSVPASLKTVNVTSAKNIGSNAFKGCSNITDILIGDGATVTAIGSEAFSGCTALTRVVIGNRVESIGDSAFNGCASLVSITLTSSVTSIGSAAFYNCDALETIIIPYGVTSIEANAFAECDKLKNVFLGNGVTSIGEGAFYDCIGLTSITIPDSVATIGRNAFNGCAKLKSVVLGKGVTNIGINAFYCYDLEKVYYRGTATDWNKITINNGWFDDGNTYLTKATRYYYSETEKSGNWWHYDESGNVAVW